MKMLDIVAGEDEDQVRCPRTDSNRDLSLRRRLLYPLSYEDFDLNFNRNGRS
jgi:hypothetical protein